LTSQMIETVTQGGPAAWVCTAGNAVQAKRRGIDAGGFSLERDQWRYFQADRSAQPQTLSKPEWTQKVPTGNRTGCRHPRMSSRFTSAPTGQTPKSWTVAGCRRTSVVAAQQIGAIVK